VEFFCLDGVSEVLSLDTTCGRAGARSVTASPGCHERARERNVETGPFIAKDKANTVVTRCGTLPIPFKFSPGSSAESSAPWSVIIHDSCFNLISIFLIL
jgi:hypothetical protein